MYRRLHTVFSAACLAATLAGCGSVPPPLEASQRAPLTEGYPLAPGDRVRITVFNEPNLTGEYNVTAQGAISFPLIGDVPITGRTTEQLSQDIRAKLTQGDYLNNPRVSAEILNYRPYYILGEVNKSGEYPFSNGLTIQQAVAVAGGFTFRANRGKVFLRRSNGPERTVDLDGPPVQVLPGDTIRIGERYL